MNTKQLEQMNTEKAIKILDALISMVHNTRSDLVSIGLIKDEGTGLAETA